MKPLLKRKGHRTGRSNQTTTYQQLLASTTALTLNKASSTGTMSAPSEYTDFAAQMPKQPEYAVDPGCADSATLLGAATAVSVGISTVLQQMTGLRDRMTYIERPSKELRSPRRETKKNSSLTDSQRKGATIDDEKKDDVMANVKSTISDEMNGVKREATPSTIPPQGILYNSAAAVDASSPARARSNKVVRITPPRNSSSDWGNSATAGRPPVARMRSHSVDSTTLDRKMSSPSRTLPKSPEEVKAEKQRKWRSKMKLAQEQQRLEKRALTSGPRARRRRSSSRGSRGLAAVIGDHVLDMIVAHCGDADDTAYMSDSDDSRMDESSTSSERSRNGKSRKSKQNRRKSRSNDKRGDASARVKSREDLGDKGSGSNEGPSVKRPVHHVPERSGEKKHSHFQNSQAPSFEIAELPPLRKNQSLDPLSDVSNVSSMASAELNMNETDYVRAFVHDMVTVGYQFFWQKEMMEMAPKAVVLRLKPGWKKPEGTFCGPRMSWYLDEFEAYGINLFDIKTLDHATPTQLKEYPFAVPSRTVNVSMNRGQEFVFEAPSKDAALRFVYGMKLLVARLSFSLVIGNMDGIVELLDLNPPGNMVKRRTRPQTSLHVAAIDDLSQELIHRAFSL